MPTTFSLPATVDKTKVTVAAFDRAAADAGNQPETYAVPLSELGGGDNGLPLPANNTYVGQEVLTQWNAGQNMNQWSAVYLSAAGTWLLADANGSGTFPARGIIVATTTNGSKATVLVKGHVRNDTWNWTVGGNIYLSETGGALTQTAPTTASNVQAVGWADSSDSIILNVTPTFRPVT